MLNRYKPIGTTAEVNFKTVRPCFRTRHSHINQVVSDTETWEKTAAFRIEQAAEDGLVEFYARNDHLGLVVPYKHLEVRHDYEPDFLVHRASGMTVLLEIKGYEDNKARAKHEAARRWVKAANNWGRLGQWHFHVCRNPQVIQKELAALEHGVRWRGKGNSGCITGPQKSHNGPEIVRTSF